MKRALKIIGGVLVVAVVVLAGAVAYVLNIDLNDWKPEIREAVKDATGRDLEIAGPIEFNLGSDTYFKATGITLSNAAWGSRPQMVEVGSVELGFKLFSLLGNSPDITIAHVDKVRAIIETNAQGVSNTDFQGAAAGGEPMDHGTQQGMADHGGGGGDLILPIIRDLRIADVEVVMKDGVAGTEQAFKLSELTLGSNSAVDPLKLNLDATYDNLDLLMQGQIGSLASMTDSAMATPVDIVGNLAGVDLAINGQIQDLAGQKGIDLKVSALGTELADAARTFAKLDVPSLGGFKVDATLKGDGDELAVAPLSVDLGRDDLIKVGVTGQIADALNQDGIDLAVTVNSPQIANLSPIAEQMAGQKVPPLGPLAVAMKVQGGMEDGLAANDISVNLGEAATLLLSVTGKVADLMQQDGIALQVAANSPELGNLSDIAKSYSGQGIPKIGPMALSAQVDGGMQKGLGLNGLSLDFGKPDTIAISVKGGIENLLAQTGVDLSIAAVSPEVGNLSPLVEAFSDAAVPALGPLKLNMKVAGDANATMALSDLDLALGKAETLLVQANGSVADLVALSGANLGFKVVSPDLSVLSKAAGSDVPPIGPVDIAGTIQGDQGKPITLNPFTAKIGGSDISGTATIDGTGAVPRIDAVFTSNRFDLNDVTPQGKGGKASGGQASSGSSGGSSSGGAGDGKVIPNDPLPLDGLKAVNAKIAYKAGTFVATMAEMTDLNVTLSLEGGKLTITPLSAKIGEGSLDGTISLDGSQAEAPLSIFLNGTKMGLDSLLAGAGMREKIVGPLDLHVDLKGAGSTPRKIAASLNGKAGISMYDSRVLKKAVDEALGKSISDLLSSDGGWIVIDCAVFDYDLTKGLAETKAGYVASGPVTVTTKGTANLATEELDMKVKPSGGIASLPLVVSGSFADPSVSPDAVSLGTGLLAGALTGGLAPALLAVVADLPEGHPCRKDVAESQEQIQNQPTQPEEAAQNPVESAKETLEQGAKDAIEKGIGGGLKKLFGN